MFQNVLARSSLAFLLLIFLVSCLPFQEIKTQAHCHPLLKQASQTPYENLNDVLASLTMLEDTLTTLRDTRAAFAATYLLVSQNIIYEIEQEAFTNKTWITQLTLHFANAYREAFWQAECSNSSTIADSWRFAFKAEHPPLLSALLGVNAHINHDLAFSLVATSIHTNQASKYKDHNLVNSILAQSIDQIEIKLANFDPTIQTLDDSFGPLEEHVLLELLIDWREQAWQKAIRLTRAKTELDKAHVIWSINTYAKNTAEHLNFLLSVLP